MSDAAKLMTQQTDPAKLAERYGNFMVPAARVRINGTPLTQLDIVLESLTVHLSLDSCSCSFTMGNVYELGEHCFRQEAKEVSRPGSVVQVELGYGSALTEVFYGYIHEVSFEIGSMNMITVTALDVRRLMQEQKVFLKKYAEEDGKAVVQKILAVYRPLLKEVHFEGEMPKKAPALHKGNDLEYIRAICSEADMEFLVLGSEGWIRPLEQKKSVILQLEGNRSLIRFTKTMVYKDLTLKTRILDEAAASQGKNQPSAITLEVKTDSGYQHSLGIPQEQFLLSDRTDDAQTARKRLEKARHALLRETQGGSGECIGLPELVPGRHIEITNLDDLLNGIYYLKTVTHSLSGSDFQTSFTVGGYGE